jgi:hypothetical protein
MVELEVSLMLLHVVHLRIAELTYSHMILETPRGVSFKLSLTMLRLLYVVVSSRYIVFIL